MKTIFTALALAAVGPAWAANSAPPVTVANPSLNVNVTNNPLPVTVTNPSSGNVVVANPATNPVKTSIDQFPRTPVHYQTSDPQFSVSVPNDKSLVIETISVGIGACIGDGALTFARFNVFIASTTESEFVPIPLTPNIGTVVSEAHALHNVRVVAAPGTTISLGFSATCTTATNGFSANFWGYLVDQNTPIRAP